MIYTAPLLEHMARHFARWEYRTAYRWLLDGIWISDGEEIEIDYAELADAIGSTVGRMRGLVKFLVARGRLVEVAPGRFRSPVIDRAIGRLTDA